ncbi:MAG: hypothetical protein ACK4YP_23380, partial [Myxococcota bacterium]
VEAEVAGLPPTPTGARVARDLGGALVFLAKKDDLVLVPKAPTPGFLADLARVGFVVPEVVEGGPERIEGRRITGIVPWGWSPAVCAAYATLGAPAWDPAHRAFYEKTWAVERLRERPDLCDPAVVGVVCRSWDEVAAVATPRHVLKAPLGTAGRGNRRWGPDVEPWARRVLAEQGALVVEPWLDRVVDLSVQIDVGDRVAVAQPGRFLTDARGGYRGAVLGSAYRDLPKDTFRAAFQAHATLREAALHVGAALRDQGFRGPAGIDALLYRGPDGLALKPLVEVNPRMTMGRVARALGERVRHTEVGLWVQVSRDEVRAAGFAGLPAWAEALRARAPLTTKGDPALIAGGALFTTDPAAAERLVTVLVVAESLEACRGLLGLAAPSETRPNAPSPR